MKRGLGSGEQMLMIDYRCDEAWILQCDYRYQGPYRGKETLYDWRLKLSPIYFAVKAPTNFTGTWIEFYINGQKFSMQAAPMLRVRVGSMQHWRIVNGTNELHPFHIHQIHFLAFAENGAPLSSPEWLDTVNVPYGHGTVDLIMDFTDPIIKGLSVFHCHLLSHEDKGMMAKILFE